MVKIKKKQVKTALIFGVTGQDGSYLTRLLLSKNYQVHGVKRRSSSLNTDRIDDIYEDFFQSNKKFILHHGDMTDTSSLQSIIGKKSIEVKTSIQNLYHYFD